jgi:predicted transglutaminase-like cysteine proteinase
MNTFFRSIAAAVALALVATSAAANTPSGRDALRSLDAPAAGPVSGAAFPKWTGALGRDWAYQGADQACAAKMGRDCYIARWESFLRGAAKLSAQRQLAQVNAFVNATSYRPDSQVWGKSDYWAAPGEFFARGGDCEDYAIAKYMSLKQLGFDPKAMRILVLKDTRRDLLHAVLAVEHAGQTYILDNLSGSVRTWAELPDYRPLYSVNEAAFWLHPGLRTVG